MKLRRTALRVRVALVAILAALPGLAFVHGRALAPAGKQPEKKAEDEAPPARTAQAWTTDEALAQLAVYPHDPYLQYVALQLARRDKNLDAAGNEVARLVFNEPRDDRNDRFRRVDLFSIFTGALAVQESLQLDSMRGTARNLPPQDKERQEKRRKEIIDVVKLTGPTIKSHPWDKMLGDKKPDVGRLARHVPEDFYYVEVHSLTKMLGLLDDADLWAAHLLGQATREARTQRVGERLRQQLVIETNPWLRPVYDTVVEDVAVTGSDLFVAEGSDVTVLFKLKKPGLFKDRMDGFLDNVQKARRDVKRSEGEYHGIRYVYLTSPERDVHVFSAYPEEGLHVRSNSKAGFFRVLEAVQGRGADFKPVRRLGDSKEFAYIRTLMPRGAREEDAFVYLSDPFIRRLVGPQVKLTERRRVLCYNHLRMIGHASLLYRTERGRAPKSVDELARAECCPGKFNEGELVCADGGKYTLSADGSQGVCSHHGHAHALVPCCEQSLAWVTGTEADEYNSFLTQYNSYWRTFFDPIAVRVKVTPKSYRLETIILPLIDNSIYQGMALALGGKPAPLDSLPVPKRNILSVAAKFDKGRVLKEAKELTGEDLDKAEREAEQELARSLGIPERDVRDLNALEFVTRGLGDQVGLHVYDAPPLFDLDMPSFLGEVFGSGSGGRRGLGGEGLMIGFLIASFNSPVYISLPVQDAKVVDGFLERLDKALAVAARRQENLAGWFRLEPDFYKAELKKGVPMRSWGLRLGPVKWRFHWARIGQALYIASKPFILEDLLALEGKGKDDKQAKSDPGPAGHALVRLRPKNWDRVLADYRLSWAENNRQACLANLGPLSSVGRAVAARRKDKKDKAPTGAELGRSAHRLADRLYAVHFYCPEGGRYTLSRDGKTCSCGIHGNARDPRQKLAPGTDAGPTKVLENFGGLTATLTFLEDGLHAVVVLER